MYEKVATALPIQHRCKILVYLAKLLIVLNYSSCYPKLHPEHLCKIAKLLPPKHLCTSKHLAKLPCLKRKNEYGRRKEREKKNKILNVPENKERRIKGENKIFTNQFNILKTIYLFIHNYLQSNY